MESGARVVRNPVAGLASAALATDAGQRASEGVLRAHAAFNAKPWQSTAVALSALSFFLTVVALLAPWVQFGVDGFSVNGSDASIAGSVDLARAIWCITINVDRDEQRDRLLNARTCGTVALVDVAPALTYLLTAGGLALFFLLVSLVVGLLALRLTYLRRTGGSRALPACLRWCGRPSAPPIAHGANIAVLCAGWACFAGIFHSQYVEADLTAIMASGRPLTTPAQLSGGFGCAVAAAVFSAVACVLTAVFREEQARVPEGPATTAIARAVADAYAVDAVIGAGIGVGDAAAGGGTDACSGSATASQAGSEGSAAAAAAVSDWGVHKPHPHGHGVGAARAPAMSSVRYAAVPGAAAGTQHYAANPFGVPAAATAPAPSAGNSVAAAAAAGGAAAAAALSGSSPFPNAAAGGGSAAGGTGAAPAAPAASLAPDGAAAAGPHAGAAAAPAAAAEGDASAAGPAAAASVEVALTPAHTAIDLIEEGPASAAAAGVGADGAVMVVGEGAPVLVGDVAAAGARPAFA